ncbi:Virginiamycin B lyase protein [Marine Group I thaumarchaeote SCGC AAA799-P11]|uniref:Virginiamycin B lyase protein n=1 Tax=Marine Group I thaumarchaeote SCGC AAA799-P11 TaxID=1502295 RepID=A0A087S3F4_9ARCH|nr:Virginiamycin B lyase protein [Marine Group I thaumarchaeote SCGC AAA799-P11]
MFSLIPSAYAHPFLLDSEPPAALTTPEGVERVTIYFSEAVDVDFSNIKVFDGNGEQVDNKDTAYFDGEASLVVTTPPLEDGVYTVTTKVLSKVDGHLVDYALIFGIGDVKLDTSLLDQQKNSESVFVPESLARFPGLVGQTIVLGAIISSILVWTNLQKKRILEEDLSQFQLKFENKFSAIVAIGLALVFSSNFAILAIQTWRLETGMLEVIQTSFGMTWTLRMGITIALLGVWFVFEKIKIKSTTKLVSFLILSLILIGTTTMMGHGAASEQIPAIILDYAHNLLSSVWIGGVIFFAFVLLPTFNILPSIKKEKITLVTIPKFSTIIIVSLGILLITGPTLLWFLEDDVTSLTISSYGYLLFAKIVVGFIMISIGGFNQFKIFKNGEKDLQENNPKVYNKIKRTLKIESLLGVILLLFVAFLTNTGLPAGEIQITEAHAQNQGFQLTEFSENAKFDIVIDPFSTGKNKLIITTSDLNNNPIKDMSGLKVKISNPSKNIRPIEVPMVLDTSQESKQTFEGEVTFGFSGTWIVLVEMQRLDTINENLEISLFIKPHLENISTKITEFEFPEDATPLVPIYDKKGNIWISDPLKSRLWKYNIQSEEFQKFGFNGKSSIMLEMDNAGNIWFTDIPESQIGKFNPNNEEFQLYQLPSHLMPTDQNPIAIELLSDNENNIWITITNKNVVLKLDPETAEFTEYLLPTKDSGPFSLALDSENNIWYSGTISGKIGVIDVQTSEIREFIPNEPLEGPEAMIFDSENNLWIAEHTGSAITKFNPLLETFEKISVPDTEALPFGMVFDKYQNLWFAQHVVDTIGVYDLTNKEFLEIDIPTPGSFTQFVTIDDDENIWFVEQQANKLSKIEISEIPNLSIQADDEKLPTFDIKYVYLVAPVFTIGIVAASLFFVKSVQDKRRLDEKIV